jgi:uroporphyrinogen decarboxylase
MSMTSRERVQAACRRGNADRIPRDMWMEYGVFKSLLERFPGRDLLEHFRVDVRPVLPAATQRETDFSPYFDRDAEWDEWGRGRVWDDQRHYAEYFYPLQHARSLAEIVEYPWPDLDEDYRYRDVRGQVRSWQEAGYAVVADVVETVFEVAWQLRSMDALFEDIKFRPDWAEVLLDRITEQRAFGAAKFAEAGADVVQVGASGSPPGCIESSAQQRRRTPTF